ncbi:MAG: ABC transporter ATP-binding protein/permease [Paracoccaceae bacterium]|jgi:ABC-type transport system involved in Fe-S cluster assembly fused permease/ATPase subunit
MSDNKQSGNSRQKSEKQAAWNTTKRVAPFVWPAGDFDLRARVVLAMLALVGSKFIAILAPILQAWAVDDLAEAGVSDFVLGAVGLTIAYGIARIATNGFQQLRDALFAKVAQRALRRLALETFEHIHKLSMRYHITRKTGGLSRIIERGVKGVEFLLRYLVFSTGPLILELVFISAAIFWKLQDWRYVGIIFITIVFYVWFTFAITEWRVKLRRKMNEQDTDANQKAIDSLLNFETVKYFNAEKREAARYDRAMEGYEAAALKTSYSLAFLNFGQAVLITLGLVGVMWLAAVGVQSGELTVGDFVLVNAYMIQITMPLNFLGTVYREIRQALVDMRQMFDLLEEPAEVTDKPGASALSVKGGGVTLSNVRFSYEKERPILHDVSIDVPAGQTVAIVGPSGSGKSTIGRLLFRFYDVTDGAVCIDGQDIRDITQESLHQAIGVVPQDTVLFNDTIFYNIAYGREDATRGDVIQAAKDAQIHDFIMSLPDAYDSLVGERGLKLSGGEKQRVGIARTLLKDPPILLLDEATSALDSETEHEIQDALERAGEGRTVMIIAHRLSTVSNADKIVVLENGLVVETGTHAELLKRKGRYSDLWSLQRSEDAA